ncbi:MAG: tRNA epoxyqueuosine(34) reductase QueG, partial [Flavobacteriales bacterium]|nr:tRNA epoxyqueuosine(34) reductase QueG [Flavobacteriales bacterium]
MSRADHVASTRKQWLVQEAQSLGFAQVGVSRAAFLDEEADRLETWLKRGYAGEMAYLERNMDLR